MEAEMAQVELALMTWKDAAAARDRGAVVLIPIGTQEENGSICPMSADTLVAHEVARQVAEQNGALVAPSINYGYSSTFSRYPGTMSLKADTLQRVVVDVCENLIGNGFERLMLINCHLPNEQIMQQAAKEISGRHGILIGSFNPITLAQAASRELSAGNASAFGHGSEPIASLIRSFRPEAVHLDQAKPEEFGEFQGLPVVGTAQVRVDGGVLNLYFDLKQISETGGTGDPNASDPERGTAIMRRVVEQAGKFVQAFAKLDVRSGA
jgi:creatinine amidohydrolase